MGIGEGEGMGIGEGMGESDREMQFRFCTFRVFLFAEWTSPYTIYHIDF